MLIKIAIVMRGATIKRSFHISFDHEEICVCVKIQLSRSMDTYAQDACDNDICLHENCKYGISDT